MIRHMDLGTCSICKSHPAIGVASCHAPISVSMCEECARRGTDPEFVFQYWAEEEGLTPDNMAAPDHLNTFKDGKYLTYREWYKERPAS